MGAIIDAALLLLVLAGALVVIRANVALYRQMAGRSPALRRAAQLVLPMLLLCAASAVTHFQAPASPLEANVLPPRLTWTADAARRVVDGTRPPAAAQIVTGTVRPKEASRPSRQSPPTDRPAVVPIFYGTDRARSDKANRIAYGADRAGRLEFGRAMVSIPTAQLNRSSGRQPATKRPFFGVSFDNRATDPKTRFTVARIDTLRRHEFLEHVRERIKGSTDYKGHALIFIHGYNNDFDHALYRTAQIAYDLKFDGAPFMYSWPSGGSFTTYTYDRDSARQTVRHLRDFIDLAVSGSGATSVSVIAHGMGSQPLLSVLSDLRQMSPGAPRLHQLIFVAPDIDRDAFEIAAQQFNGISAVTTLYASSSDLALGVSRRFAGDIGRAGDVGEGGPAIVTGIDTVDISALNTAFFAMNQPTYAEQSALIQDIERLLLTGVRPPDRRLPILQRIAGPSGTYWRHP
jgi:esterase/lipase superfamily enzyme